MLEVKKCGKTEYGYWAYGSLKYNGLDITDIFSVNRELEANKSYAPEQLSVVRTKKGNFKIKITC